MKCTLTGAVARKVVFVMVLCFLAMSCAYAGKIDIVAQLSPYSHQSVSMTSGIHHSSYGFNVKGGARYNILDKLTAGLDFDFDLYRYKELAESYLVFGFMAKAGYSFDFTDAVFGETEIGLGLDLRKVGSRTKPSFGVEYYFGGGYRFTDMVSATAGLDLHWGFQEGGGSSSVDIATRIMLGARISL